MKNSETRVKDDSSTGRVVREISRILQQNIGYFTCRIVVDGVA